MIRGLSGLSVREVLEPVEASLEWDLDLAMGTLSIEQAPLQGLKLFHVVRAGARTLVTALAADEQGRVAPTRVPAGPATVERGYFSRGRVLPDRPKCRSSSVTVYLPKAPQVLARVSVESGEHTALGSLGED